MRKQFQVAAFLVAAFMSSGCVVALKSDEIAGQSLEGSARWAEGFSHKVMGMASGTAHGAYSPLFSWVYWLFNIPIVSGGQRTAYVKYEGDYGYGVSWGSNNPIEAAARYDAIQSVAGADVLIAVRVRRDVKDWAFGFWRDETVTVTGKAIQISD